MAYYFELFLQLGISLVEIQYSLAINPLVFGIYIYISAKTFHKHPKENSYIWSIHLVICALTLFLQN